MFIHQKVEDISLKHTCAVVISTLGYSSFFFEKLTTLITQTGWIFSIVCCMMANALEIFKNIQYELLPDKNEAAVDINDILVFGRDKIKHETNFKKLIRLSHDASLKLHKSKSKFR